MNKDTEKLIDHKHRSSSLTTAPTDKFNLIYIICLILGVGTLLAYNMMVTASDFLTHEYPDYGDIMFWVVPAYSVPNTIFTLLMILYGSRFSFTSRIVGSFLSTGIVVGLIPFFAVNISETPSYDLIMGICGFIGFSAAVLQATTIGFTNLLPGKYTQANIAGQSVAGILACLIRIGTKAFEPSDSHGYVQGGWIYFLTGAIGSIVCAFAFVYALKTVFVKHHLKGYLKRKKEIVTQKGKTIAISNQTMNILTHIADEEEYDDVIQAQADNGKIINIESNNNSNSNIDQTPDNISNLDGSLAPAIIDSANADSETINESLARHLQQQQQQIQSQSQSQAHNSYHSINDNGGSSSSNSGHSSSITHNNASKFPPPQHPQALAERYHLTTEHHPDSIDSKPKADFATVWNKVKRPATALLSIFVITFLIFPGLITNIDSQYDIINKNSWMPVILITEFNICDYIGRQFFASWTSFGFDSNTLWIGCVSRIVLYPLFLALYKGWIVNDIVAHIAMIVFATTNGHFCCLGFIYAPGLVESHEQEQCAAIMSSALVGGIFIGAAIALAISSFFL